MTLQGSGRKLVNVGNYRLTGRRLGKGNFARVEEAVHLGLNFKVAVKVMNVNAIKEEYVVRNLYRESRILSKLCHPCVVALFQTMQYGNIYYIVTELVDGSDLCGFIKGQRHGKLEERFTKIYARQLISAIAHMHNMGIVHRDLKMENVMLNSYHTQIKIVDFGLSNIYSEDSPLRTHCGSPEYAAPELFVAGKSYGPEVDVWSLGVILYGMVVGQLPFVNSRENHISAQDRRKKLLAQINLGISGPQRKAIAFLSPEFKSMMNKLLIADSSKRVTTKELMCHPWVTEKGKKAIRCNPYKKLDEQTKNLIITEIAKMVNADPEAIRTSVTNDPNGNVAGMYNIVCYNQLSRQNSVDLITKNVAIPSLYTRSNPCSPKIKSDSKTILPRHENLKSAPPSKAHPSKIPTASPYNRSKLIHSPKRESTASSKFSVGETKKMKRVTLSADAHNKRNTSQKVSPQEGKPKSFKSMYSQPSTGLTSPRSIRSPLRVENHEASNQDVTVISYKKCAIASSSNTVRNNELHVIGNHGLSKALHCAPSTTINPPCETSPPARIPSSKGDEENKTDGNTIKPSKTTSVNDVFEQPRCKSEPTQNRRSYTGPVHTAERAQKRKSFLPVASSQSTPNKGAGIPPVGRQANIPRNRRTLTSTIPITVEQSRLATGDVAKRPVTTPVKRILPLRKPFVDEPIARTIAGYVANNVGNRLQAFKFVTSKGEGRNRNKY